MKRVQFFYHFTIETLGREPSSDEEIVDTCLQAMQEGVLDVCAQNGNGRYVWTCFGMTSGQLQRTCGLMQQAGVESSILWTSSFSYHEFRGDIEYLWTDLKIVERFLMQVKILPMTRVCVVQELDRRRTWDAGLRRAWLAACMV